MKTVTAIASHRDKIEIIPEAEEKSFRDFQVFEFPLMLNTKNRKSRKSA